LQDLQAIREAGLDRVHVGMESGSDRVLKLVNKGASAEKHVQAGQLAVQSGLTLSEYIMPGLGGREHSREHALETARVLNQIDPQYIRLRSLQVIPGTPLADLVAQGGFSLLSDDETVREIRLLIQSLEGIGSQLASDHIMNLLEEVQGTFPQDKPHMLEVIDGYLQRPDTDKLLYRLGRRGGALRSVQELDDPGKRSQLERAKRELESSEGKDLESIIGDMGIQGL
jgi:radical SAM superfamily enzyme